MTDKTETHETQISTTKAASPMTEVEVPPAPAPTEEPAPAEKTEEPAPAEKTEEPAAEKAAATPTPEENMIKEETPPSPKEEMPPSRLAEGNMSNAATPPPAPEESLKGGTPPRPRIIVPSVSCEDSLSPDCQHCKEDEVIYTPEALRKKRAQNNKETSSTEKSSNIMKHEAKQCLDKPPEPNEIKCTPNSRVCAIQ